MLSVGDHPADSADRRPGGAGCGRRGDRRSGRRVGSAIDGPTRTGRRLHCRASRPGALRRFRGAARGRDVQIGSRDDTAGTASLWGRLFATDAAVLFRRLDAMARAVCQDDPRSMAERRADALGALAAGGHDLACACGQLIVLPRARFACRRGRNPRRRGGLVAQPSAGHPSPDVGRRVGAGSGARRRRGQPASGSDRPVADSCLRRSWPNSCGWALPCGCCEPPTCCAPSPATGLRLCFSGSCGAVI